MENNDENNSKPFFKFELYWDESKHEIVVKRCNNDEIIKNMINDSEMKYIQERYIDYNDMVNTIMLIDMNNRRNPNIDNNLKRNFIKNIESLIWNIPVTNFKPDDIKYQSPKFEVSNITNSTIVLNENL